MYSLMPSVLHIGRHFFTLFYKKILVFFELFLVSPKLNCSMKEFEKIAWEVTLGLNGLKCFNVEKPPSTF